jgi:hypothetical protein
MEKWELESLLTKKIIKSYLNRTGKRLYSVRDNAYGSTLESTLRIEDESEIENFAKWYVKSGDYEINEITDVDSLHVYIFPSDGYIEMTTGIALHAMIEFKNLNPEEYEFIYDILEKCRYGGFKRPLKDH